MTRSIAWLATLFVAGAAFAEEDAREAKWIVVGRVTDAFGKGMAGVKIVAHCGAGTLRPTGETASDSNGEYRLEFGPLLVSSGGCPLQAAIISPIKEGWSERNLHRQGDLEMAGALPSPGEGRGSPPERIVLPGKPFRVDFVMLPSAFVALGLIDERDLPLSGAAVWVDGDTLPPACSALMGNVTLDAEGKALLEDLPVGYEWRIRLGDDYIAAVTLTSPGTHTILLRRATHPKGGWCMLETISHVDPAGAKLPATQPGDPPWSSSHGVDCRLRAEKVRWKAGEKPAVLFEARNSSRVSLDIKAWSVEVDGIEHTLKVGDVFFKALMEGGREFLSRFVLDGGWIDESGRPLSLAPGSHVLRFHARYVHPTGTGGMSSNRVVIDVSD